MTLTINGEPRTVDEIPPYWSLLDLIRVRLGLTGTKDACRTGDCGSCTVQVDGDAVSACLVPAGQVEGLAVTTIEGLTAGASSAILRDAFAVAGAVQCGFCTPGMLMTAEVLLRAQPEPSEAQIRTALAGNLCRCTGYQKIIDAVLLAGARMAEGAREAA